MAQAKHILIARTQGPEAGLEAYLNAPSSKNWPAYKKITNKRTPQTRLAAYCEIFHDEIGEIVTPEQHNANLDATQIIAEQIAALKAQLEGMNDDTQTGVVVEAPPEFVNDDLFPVLESNPDGALSPILANALAQKYGSDADTVLAYAKGEMDETESEPVDDDEKQSMIAKLAAMLSGTQKGKSEPTRSTNRSTGTTTPKVAVACITAGEAWEAAGGGETFKPKDMSKPANNGQLYRLNTLGKLAIRG